MSHTDDHEQAEGARPAPLTDVSAPVMQPDAVRGFVYNDNRERPDRLFYLLDSVSNLVWEADGYQQPVEYGEKPQWLIFLKCPACGSDLKLETSRKQLEVTLEGIETGEPIGCSYFVSIDGYRGMCPWRAELQPGRGQLVEVRTQQGPLRVRIDAIVRRA